MQDERSGHLAAKISCTLGETGRKQKELILHCFAEVAGIQALLGHDIQM